MTFKEIIQKIGSKNKDRKEKFHELDEDFRMQKILEQRQKPSNERELEQFVEKERQSNIKQALEYYRKKEQEDINFNHNSLSVPNITKGTKSIIKEKNLFNHKGNMFAGQKSVLHGNKNLLKSGRILK